MQSVLVYNAHLPDSIEKFAYLCRAYFPMSQMCKTCRWERETMQFYSVHATLDLSLIGTLFMQAS